MMGDLCLEYFCTLISIISLFSILVMQNKSVDLHNDSKTFPSSHIGSFSQCCFESMSVSSLFKTLSEIIQNCQQDVKLAITRLHMPSFFDNLKNTLSSLEVSDPKFDHKNKGESSSKLSTVQSEQMKIIWKEKEKGMPKKDLGKAMVFVSDGLQFLHHVTFDDDLQQNPQKIFEIIAQDINDQSRNLMAEALSSRRSLFSVTDNLKRTKTKEEVERELRVYLRQSLLVSILQGIKSFEVLQKRIQEEKKVKQELNFFWKCLQKQQKLRILLLNCKDVEGLSYHLTKDKIYLPTKKLQNQVKKILISDQPDLISSVFRCRLGEILDPFNHYLKLLFATLKKEAENSKRKRSLKQIREDRDYNSQHKTEQKQKSSENIRKKKGKARKSLSLESNETNYTEHQRHIMQKSIHQIEKSTAKEYESEVKPSHYYLQLQRSEEYNNEKRELSQSQREERSIKSSKMNRKQNSKDKNEILRTEEQKNLELTHETDISKQGSVSSKKTFSSQQSYKYPPQSLNDQHSSQQIKKATIQKLAQQLSEMSDAISEEANQYFQRRIVAFERIQFLLNHYSIPIKLFGSCANGIAVKNSDIDIAIDASILQWMDFLPENERVVVALERLQQLFRVYPCFMDIKVIKTAAIPIIKLTIDTSLIFLSLEYTSLNRPHNSGKIQADITIQTPATDNQSSHLGIRTTSAITVWLCQIKSLHTIIIIMKSFFTINKLNLSYEGGLNTISMIVMFVALIRHRKMEREDNEALVLENILNFYANQFNEKDVGIDLLDLNGEHIFYKKNNYPFDNSCHMKADLQIRDPICQSKNMTRNCYLYPQIKKMFKNMLQSCFHSSQDQLQQILSSLGESNPKKELNELTSSLFQKRNVFLSLHKQMTPHF